MNNTKREQAQQIADLLTQTGYMLGQECESFQKQDYVLVLNEIEKIKNMICSIRDTNEQQTEQ